MTWSHRELKRESARLRKDRVVMKFVGKGQGTMHKDDFDQLNAKRRKLMERMKKPTDEEIRNDKA